MSAIQACGQRWKRFRTRSSGTYGADGGKELIRQIVQFANREEARHRVVFIEDYDLSVARYLVQGVDVWLNTPLRPMEASGTSGMKVLANGGLNVSIPDGWWAEGYDPR